MITLKGENVPNKDIAYKAISSSFLGTLNCGRFQTKYSMYLMKWYKNNPSAKMQI